MTHSGYLLLILAAALMVANFLGAAFSSRRLRTNGDERPDRRVFELDAKRWDAFMAQLAEPPRDNPRLRKLLRRKPNWKV